jgi:creatinine amidohydrolase
MRPAEVAATIAADPRLIVPVGTCQQNGPHLPMGADSLLVERLADALSAEFGVLLAPTVAYGVNTASEQSFAGSASLRRKTLHRVLNDLMGDWERSGVREFVLLTAHANDAHLEAMETVITSAARVRAVNILGLDLGDLLDGQAEPLHGDEVDTSLLLYVAPELVDMSLAEDYTLSPRALRRYRRGWLRIPGESSGSIGHPTLASAEKGRLVFDRILERVRERIFLASAPAE